MKYSVDNSKPTVDEAVDIIYRAFYKPKKSMEVYHMELADQQYIESFEWDEVIVEKLPSPPRYESVQKFVSDLSLAPSDRRCITIEGKRAFRVFGVTKVSAVIPRKEDSNYSDEDYKKELRHWMRVNCNQYLKRHILWAFDDAESEEEKEDENNKSSSGDVINGHYNNNNDGTCYTKDMNFDRYEEAIYKPFCTKNEAPNKQKGSRGSKARRSYGRSLVMAILRMILNLFRRS